MEFIGKLCAYSYVICILIAALDYVDCIYVI